MQKVTVLGTATYCGKC